MATGVNCTVQGTTHPDLLPGYWRSAEEEEEDPYFETRKIYACDPPSNCLGG